MATTAIPFEEVLDAELREEAVAHSGVVNEHLVAAGQLDRVDVRAQRQLPREVFAESGVGAGDEERVVGRGFQLTASTAARISDTSLRVV